jgi:tetratricopeptide (TPR) repeat protein
LFWTYSKFEDILNEANRIREIAPLKAIELYKQAIGLYRGDYLAENGYSEWLVPLRNHYNRLYIQSLLRLVELLKEREEHDQILDVCERGLSIEPLEEVLHIYFIEALLKLGQMKHALSHYEYVTSYFYRELGVKPSAVMRNLYKKIQAHNEEKGEMTLSQIKIRLEEENISGALFCDLDYFKFIYNLELRRSTRLPTTNYLGLLTLISKGTGVASQQKIKEIMGSLRQLLYASLRKGDLFSFWNDTQMVFILFNIKEDGLGKIEERIEKNFHQQGKADIFNLELSFGPTITK